MVDCNISSQFVQKYNNYLSSFAETREFVDTHYGPVTILLF